MVEALTAHPEAVAAYSGGWFVDEGGNPFADWKAEPATRAEMLSGDKSFPKIPALVARRDAAERAGWFDESYQRAEDMEFVCRLLLEGDFVAVPRLLVHYRRHKDAGTVRSDAIRLTWEASERFLGEQIEAARERGDDAIAKQLTENRKKARRMFASHEALKVLRSLRQPSEFGEMAMSFRQAMRLDPLNFLGSLVGQAAGLVGRKARAMLRRT